MRMTQITMKIQSCHVAKKTKASYCNDVQSNIDIQRGIKINSQYGHTIIFHVVVVFFYIIIGKLKKT